MLRLILVTLLSITLVTGFIFDTTNNTRNKAFKEEVLSFQDENEDYGCVHEDHEQFDDGDSININYLNKISNNKDY
jgi:hypothetical protein